MKKIYNAKILRIYKKKLRNPKKLKKFRESWKLKKSAESRKYEKL